MDSSARKISFLILLSTLGRDVGAAEFATGGGAERPYQTAVALAGPSMASLHQCIVSARESGAMMGAGQNMCGHDWISPSKLPQKFERAYHSRPGRIDVYDLRAHKGKVSPNNRQVHRMTADDEKCYLLEIPPPSEEAEVSVKTPRFDCSLVDCEHEGVPVVRTPAAQSISKYEDTGDVRISVRDALYPRATNQFLKVWIRETRNTGPGGRTEMEGGLKRAICDCEKAGVIDPKTLGEITTKLKAAPGASAEADRERLRKLADEIEGCANPAVS